MHSVSSEPSFLVCFNRPLHWHLPWLRSALTPRFGERQGLSVANIVTSGTGLGALTAALMRAHTLVDTTQEAHLKSSSLNSAGQQIALFSGAKNSLNLAIGFSYLFEFKAKSIKLRPIHHRGDGEAARQGEAVGILGHGTL